MNGKQIRPFGMKDKMGYLLGDLGNDLTFILSSSYLMKFYTNIMGVPAAIVGIIMMIARFVDAFTDVTMGRICDKSKPTKAGKFRPWILRMCGPVAVASFLMYQSAFADRSLTFKVAWLFITYILWGSVFYTSINIPYGSMASAISNKPEDRQSLSTYRTVGGTLSGVFMGVLVPFIAFETVKGKTVLVGSKFTIAAGVLSVLSVLCYLGCYYLTLERVRSQESVKTENTVDKGIVKNFVRITKSLFTNRALLSVIAAMIFMLLAQLTVQGMNNYVYPNVYNNAGALSLSSMLIMVDVLICAIFAKPLTKRFGRKEISVAGSLLAAVSYLICFVLRPSNVWVYLAFAMLAYTGLMLFSIMSWALITDVIDYSEIRNGVREDGTIYSVYSFSRKLGQAASAGLTGGLLSLAGYTTKTAFEVNVLDSIFNISCIVPAIGFIAVALIMGLAYPLGKKQVDENVRILAEKHGKTDNQENRDE
ncbi:transporter major facilitator family protein [Lachnospiraceae bacterium CAG:215]|nr:transporter major facilitator family protein [Lachnospiraceae bacterium CAG:215]